jgi:hypothetical protein
MNLAPKTADRILHNDTLCASVRRMHATGAWSLEQLAAELRRTAAKRRIVMSTRESAGLVDAMLGDR